MTEESKTTPGLYEVKIWRDRGVGSIFTGRTVMVSIDKDMTLRRLALSVWTMVADDKALEQAFDGSAKQLPAFVGYGFRKHTPLDNPMFDSAVGPYSGRVLSLDEHKLAELGVTLTCKLKKEFDFDF